MYVRGDIALVGWLYMVGVFVFCVVTVVATLSELPQCFNLRKLTTYAVGELKEITESFEKLDSGVYRHDHLKRIQYFTSKIGQHFNMIGATDISKPTNKMSNYRDRVPCFAGLRWRSRLSRSNLVAVAVTRSILPRKLIILASSASSICAEA
jgi:hypothetical protein